MKTKLQKAMELLKKLRDTKNDSSITNLLYVTPSQSLRNQADKMDYEQALLREVDEFLIADVKIKDF